jgi:hypothetical protein
VNEQAIFVCDQIYGAKKLNLTGIDLEFEKSEIIYIVEIKAGWNWGNASQIKQLRINFQNAAKELESKTGKRVIAVNGCCFGKDRKPDKKGYVKLCGQKFWELISGDYILILLNRLVIKPKKKMKNLWKIMFSLLIN